MPKILPELVKFHSNFDIFENYWCVSLPQQQERILKRKNPGLIGKKRFCGANHYVALSLLIISLIKCTQSYEIYSLTRQVALSVQKPECFVPQNVALLSTALLATLLHVAERDACIIRRDSFHSIKDSA